MKVVVDEGVPKKLIAALREVGVDTDNFKTEWRGIANGRLIALADALGYDVLLTNDKNMASQQSLRGRNITVVALPSNRLATVMSRVLDIVDTLGCAEPGRHIVIHLDGRRTSLGIGADGQTHADELPSVPPFR
jgi:predicted nuclease of predicted toxin-antitoxin system